jgi:hypothetical protein
VGKESHKREMRKGRRKFRNSSPLDLEGGQEGTKTRLVKGRKKFQITLDRESRI